MSYKSLRRMCGRFCRQADGATSAEYALLLGMVAAALVIGIVGYRGAIVSRFQYASGVLAGTQNPTPGPGGPPGGTPPGQGGTPPGQGGTPPGQGGNNK